MPLKVVGVGYPRTGTASLKVALEQLGLGRCYHMSEAASRPQDWPLWMAALDGHPVDLEEILGDYGASTDVPGCLVYRAIAERYPAAKFILTVRDGDRWFRSTQQTVLSADLAALLTTAPPEINALLHKMGFHPEDPATHDRETMIARMNTHNEGVKAFLPPSRLLVHDLSQGWAPLCTFIGVPIPDTTFPHVNTTHDWRKHIALQERFDPDGPRRNLQGQVGRNERRDS